MGYHIHWTTSAEISYAEEIEFINKKWNIKEIEKFISLSNDFIESISKNPTIGIYNRKFKFFSLVISKQTTLVYKIVENKNQIDLLLFWNNKKNPKRLQKLL